MSTASGAPHSHLDLEVLAAQLRRHADDLALYAGLMLGVLSSALPPEMIRVRREGRLKARLAGREPAVLGVSVLLGAWRYELDRAEFAGRPTARIIHESGGVAMSNRVVTIDEWSQRMAADLVNVVGAHGAAVEALYRLTAQ